MRRFWKRRNFAQQLILAFLSILLLHLFIVQILNGYYTTRVLEEKILGASRQTLKQAALNVDTTLARYEDLVNLLLSNQEFQRCIRQIDEVHDETEKREIREEMENMAKEMMAYQSRIRCLSINTVQGTLFGYDRMQNDLLNQKISNLHIWYHGYHVFESATASQGIWVGTGYMDRVGTQKYYVYSYGKLIQDWVLNRRLGMFILSIEEGSLSQICRIAQISENPEENHLLIVDGEGKIVSHADKDLLGQMLTDQEGWTTDQGEYSAGDQYVVLSEAMEHTDWKILSVISKKYMYESLREVQNLIWGFCLLLALGAGGLIIYVSRKMTKEVKGIVDTMQEVGEGVLSAQIGIDKDERNELSLIAIHFNAMMNRINEQVELVRESGKREKEAEIRALEAQINPHFIYNTLDSINWLAIENDQPQISRMLSSFAQILRYQIQKSNTIVTIQEELGYLEKYLYLQKIRFEDSFEYVLECEDSLLECRIYKMIFQPFIENAILHGCADLPRGGLLKIYIRDCDEDHLVFIISDNGHGMGEEQIDEIFRQRKKERVSIGVENVLSRLDMYYGEEYSIHVESLPENGTTIHTKIPKQWDAI